MPLPVRRQVGSGEEDVSSSDLELTRDLRDSISRVWERARRLGILSIDVPLRQQLRALIDAPVRRRRSKPKRRRQG